MAHRYSTLFKWINVIVDYILLNGTLYVSFTTANPYLDWLDVYDYKVIILLINFSWFYISSIFGIYNYILKRSAISTMIVNIATLGVFIMLILFIKLSLPDLYLPPTANLYYLAIFPALLLIWRFSFLLLRKYRHRFWLGSNSIAVVGAGAAGLDFYNYIMSNNEGDYDITGIFDDKSSRVPPNMNYLGKVEECLSYVSAKKVKEIYCALPYMESERIEMLMQESDKNMVRFRLIPDVKGEIHHDFMLELFGYLPVLKQRQEPLDNKANEIVKRIFDILFSLAIILLLLSWLIPIIALLIKLDSKGPVFFKQLRSGKKNIPFYCLKFRSMIVNSESESLQAGKNDARITRIGRILRKTSIDELPQFINVLLGDMSIVGPRPHMLKHTHDYAQVINNYMVRHLLKPGITGWAQINGFRGETKDKASMRNRIKADLWYLENWSMLLDLKIICLTFWQILKYDDNVY